MDKNSLEDSYTAASCDIPWKMLQHPDTRKLWPTHLQLIPTNRCNGNCNFCSCKAEDRTVELRITELKNIVKQFSSMGTKAVTITGGGEPTMHPNIKELLTYTANDQDIDIGLVTNGKMIQADRDLALIIDETTLWLRLSVTEPEGGYDLDLAATVISRLPNVDCSFSFTICPNTDLQVAEDICDLAMDSENVTHVRFVTDIMLATDPFVQEAFREVENRLSWCKKAIFQNRNFFTKGSELCWISLIKPVLGADGYIYPCCGAQYATKERGKMPESMRMCYWSDFEFLIMPFNGVDCGICYYDNYNYALAKLMQPVEHGNHV